MRSRSCCSSLPWPWQSRIRVSSFASIDWSTPQFFLWDTIGLSYHMRNLWIQVTKTGIYSKWHGFLVPVTSNPQNPDTLDRSRGLHEDMSVRWLHGFDLCLHGSKDGLQTSTKSIGPLRAPTGRYRKVLPCWIWEFPKIGDPNIAP